MMQGILPLPMIIRTGFPLMGMDQAVGGPHANHNPRADSLWMLLATFRCGMGDSPRENIGIFPRESIEPYPVKKKQGRP